jgi:hypothetical protein
LTPKRLPLGKLRLPLRVDDMQVPVSRIHRLDLPIFSQDWWLGIVSRCPEYREVKVVRSNAVLGRLPFILSARRAGSVWGHNPHWSHIAGPIVDQGLSRAEQIEVIFSLLEQLPRGASFGFVCSPSQAYADIVRNAFKRAGFEHTTQTTYVRPPSFGDVDVLDGRKSKHRGHFKRAAKELHCEDISAKKFVEFYQTNLNAQGKASYAPLYILPPLIEEAISRGQARAIAARSKRDNRSGVCQLSACYDAAIAYVWDDYRCYYWLSTRRIPHPADGFPRPHPDASKFLAVKAMEDAQAMNLIFDTDGVTTPGSENLYRNIFGLREVESRDVFQRVTVLERFRQKCRQHLKGLFPN